MYDAIAGSLACTSIASDVVPAVVSVQLEAFVDNVLSLTRKGRCFKLENYSAIHIVEKYDNPSWCLGPSTTFGYFVEATLAPHLLLQCSQHTSYYKGRKLPHGSAVPLGMMACIFLKCTGLLHGDPKAFDHTVRADA